VRHIVRAEYDYRDFLVLAAEPLDDFEAVDARQPDIQHDQRELHAVQQLERLFAGLRRIGLQAVDGSHARNHPAYGRIVVHN